MDGYIVSDSKLFESLKAKNILIFSLQIWLGLDIKFKITLKIPSHDSILLRVPLCL